jgi:hypothetical protein
MRYNNSMETKNTPTVKRLKYVCDMLNKYSHRWGVDASQRMFNWVDEYNNARELPVWEEYCTKFGYTVGHDAYDCMA